MFFLHPKLKDQFVEIASVGQDPVSVITHSDSNLRTARIPTEIHQILANPHPHYDVSVFSGRA